MSAQLEIREFAGVSRDHEWSHELGSPSGAWISPCGMYRTLLWRTFAIGGDAAPLGFIMLNPSKADARVNDPTVVRCLGFARREGAGGIIVANLSPYRATDPGDMSDARGAGVDVLREQYNEQALRVVRRYAGNSVVFAWGAGITPWLEGAARTAREIFPGALCLGRTKSGQPRHPLMLPRNAPVERFSHAPLLADVVRTEPGR